MTPQERELLTTFLQQMTRAQAGQKDPEADALIRDASARQPDAVYLLVQRAMGLDYALQASQAQVTKLQTDIDQLRAGARSGFLDTANSWGRAAPALAQGPLAAPARAPAAAMPASSWGSGMLGTLASTAVGVVAGSFLFQGIQGLMGHHGLDDHTGANSAPPLPEAGASLAPDANDATDYVALDDGDDGLGDSGDTV